MFRGELELALRVNDGELTELREVRRASERGGKVVRVVDERERVQVRRDELYERCGFFLECRRLAGSVSAI